jgi:hypothetical protein
MISSFRLKNIEMVKHYKEKTKTIKKLVSIECDKCHKVYSKEDWWEKAHFHHINFTAGYGSVFDDHSKIECDICQHCLKEMIGGFCRITSEY